jgi:hypothetical protein
MRISSLTKKFYSSVSCMVCDNYISINKPSTSEIYKFYVYIRLWPPYVNTIYYKWTITEHGAHNSPIYVAKHWHWCLNMSVTKLKMFSNCWWFIYITNILYLPSTNFSIKMDNQKSAEFSIYTCTLEANCTHTVRTMTILMRKLVLLQ